MACYEMRVCDWHKAEEEDSIGNQKLLGECNQDLSSSTWKMVILVVKQVWGVD